MIGRLHPRVCAPVLCPVWRVGSLMIRRTATGLFVVMQDKMGAFSKTKMEKLL